jgi:hypothetical protein
MWEAIPNIVLREGDDQTDCPFCSNPPKQLCSSDDACARCISKTIAGSANAHLFAGTLAEAQKVFAQTRTKVQWKCDEPSCRKMWWATGGNVNSANDTGCPHCNKSYAQKNGEAFFTAEGVRHEHEWTHKDCRDKQPLPFDLLVFKELIEWLFELDGIQHFRPYKDTEKRRKEFAYMRGHDILKMQWALSKRDFDTQSKTWDKDEFKLGEVYDNSLYWNGEEPSQNYLFLPYC